MLIQYERPEIDIKRYVKFEKIQEETFKSVIVSKDIKHPKIKSYTENPRITKWRQLQLKKKTIA